MIGQYILSTIKQANAQSVTCVLTVSAAVLIYKILYKKPPNLPPGPAGVPILGVLPLITSRPDKKLLVGLFFC